MLTRLKNYIQNPKVFKAVVLEKLSPFMTDRKYIRAKFHNRLGVYPDLEHPKTFQEKLQWIKLNDRKSIYHQMVDKYDAKTFIINTIGGGIRYPLLVCLIHLTK